MKKKLFLSGLCVIVAGTLAVFLASCDNLNNDNLNPAHAVSLSRSGTYSFTAAAQGYEAVSPLTVTVTNTGTETTGLLTVGLSGTDADIFALNKTSLESIASGGAGSFSVNPKTGLAAGSYTATVTVSGSSGISAELGVMFSVTVPAGMNSTTVDPALRAITVAASTSDPVVLDSYTDGTKNYYLIDVGYIQRMFVSTIAEAYYNGMTPLSYSRTTVNQTTVTESMTEIISNSITVSNTQSAKVGIQGAWEKSFPIAGKFSVKLDAEWNGSWTNTSISSKSTTTSVSKMESYAESVTTSFIIGEHGEPKGNHRYGLYAVCDVYFIITTSLDNQQLLSWDTLTCARNSSYSHHWDYSPDGIFDNTPEESTITFSEDFYKTLTPPTKQRTPETPQEEGPQGFGGESPAATWTETRSAGGNEDLTSITHSPRWETIRPNLSIPELKKSGYTQLKIDVEFAYKGDWMLIGGGTLKLLIANSNGSTDIGTAEFGYNNSWTNKSYSKTVPIDAINSDTGQFMLSWSRVEGDGLFSANFSVGKRTITLTALREESEGGGANGRLERD
jgi:hypothetical protein